MKVPLRAATELTHRLAAQTRRMGHEVALDPAGVLDRSDSVALGPAGAVSPNGSCRLFQCRNGWIAANLPRESDLELVPAWLEREIAGDPWASLAGAAAASDAAAFAQAGAALGLAVAQLGEAQADGMIPVTHRLGPSRDRTGKELRVIDLSSLWAGPLCGSVFASMGHDVTRIESSTRPDPARRGAPLLDRRLNGAKALKIIDFSDADMRRDMQRIIKAADVLITGARPRALAALGLVPHDIMAANPGMVWIAVTGHGWFGPEAERIAFGDDAAVAGALVDWRGDTPLFAGDALADPLTGLAAALAGLHAIEAGGGVLIDAALSQVAAGAAQWGRSADG